MGSDVKLLILAAIGIAAGAWALTYSSQVGSLVQTTTTGYGSVVHALEPPNLQQGAAG